MASSDDEIDFEGKFDSVRALCDDGGELLWYAFVLSNYYDNMPL